MVKINFPTLSLDKKDLKVFVEHGLVFDRKKVSWFKLANNAGGVVFVSIITLSLETYHILYLQSQVCIYFCNTIHFIFNDETKKYLHWGLKLCYTLIPLNYIILCSVKLYDNSELIYVFKKLLFFQTMTTNLNKIKLFSRFYCE